MFPFPRVMSWQQQLLFPFARVLSWCRQVFPFPRVMCWQQLLFLFPRVLSWCRQVFPFPRVMQCWQKLLFPFAGRASSCSASLFFMSSSILEKGRSSSSGISANPVFSFSWSQACLSCSFFCHTSFFLWPVVLLLPEPAEASDLGLAVCSLPFLPFHKGHLPFPKSAAPTSHHPTSHHPFAKGWTSLHPFAKACCPAGQGCPNSPYSFWAVLLLFGAALFREVVPFPIFFPALFRPSLEARSFLFCFHIQEGWDAESLMPGLHSSSPFSKGSLSPLPCVQSPFPRVPSPHLASVHQGPGPTLLALWRASSLFQGYPCQGRFPFF